MQQQKKGVNFLLFSQIENEFKKTNHNLSKNVLIAYFNVLSTLHHVKMEHNKNKRDLVSTIKKGLLLLCKKERKYEEGKKNPEINKAIWNEKRKKSAQSFTQTGYSR